MTDRAPSGLLPPAVRDAFRGRPARATLVPAAVVGATLLGCVGTCSGVPCVPVGLQYGLWLEECPPSDLRLSASLNAHGLARGQWGRIHLDTTAHWVVGDGPSPWRQQVPMTRGVDVELALIGEDGQIRPGLLSRDAAWTRDGLAVEVQLPVVPDGDYRLRATIDAGFETVVVDGPVALYAPALVHVMSDRPLYKPGQEVLLRAAVLRRTDSAPIEQRPGRWRVTAPDGTEMLVEKVGSGPWGVASTTFPLDAEAQVGTWRAVYETGGDQDAISFDVRPFKLPRFTVELEPSARWYGVGGEVVVDGTARYTSGAPVADATVRIDLTQVDGRWPMPLAWAEPIEARTDREGKFTFDLGEVPADLVDRATVGARARVTDATGETAVGASRLQLAQDSLVLTAITELGDGLVEGLNNRAYVRVTTPDGRPVRKADLVLRNPYDPVQPERAATTDEDGVAALQLDPGAPVIVVDPPPPVRARPFRPNDPSLRAAVVHPGRRVLDLEERRAFDRLHPAIAACGVWADGDQAVEVALQVDASGAPREVLAPDDAIGRCVADATRAARMPANGEPRTYDLTWTVPDSLQPSLRLVNYGVFGRSPPAEQAYAVAAAQARRCLPRGAGVDGAEAFHIHWSIRAGSRAPSAQIVEASGTGLSPAVLACARAALASAALAEPAEQAGAGVTTAQLEVPQPPGSVRPQATTRIGYEFRVAARADGREIGSGKLVFPVGNVPDLRLRATPSLASPGAEVEIELLRGPDWSGELPEELVLRKGTVELVKAKVEKPATPGQPPVARFAIPADAEGFLHVEGAGQRSVVFVRPDDALAVSLSTDAEVYRPGQDAVLTVRTTAGDAPVPAAVSLAGVDQTLSQLAPLLEPDDWGRVTVRTTGEEVFGAFGPRGLQLGQIQGENAAKAVVMRVQNLPMDLAGDVGVTASAAHAPDEVEALTTAFYRGLEALVTKVRAWEQSTPKTEPMTPEVVARLWGEVLADADAAGAPLVDAWGRPMRLRSLPEDLLAQTDPRQVAVDSTRLPEDIANWPRWVQEHQP